MDGLDLTAVHNKFRQRPVGVDIFCRVIDNFGDAGVCWRLARRLAHHHGWRVRLWIDDVDTLRRLHPFPATSANTFRLDEIDVVRWNDTTENLHPRDVVIEAFACDLPPAFRAAMTADQVWLNLEYLTAESWVDSCHGLPSPQPGGVEKFFFFPGFTTHTGGLIREPGLLRERDRFQASPQAQAEFLHRIGVPLPLTTPAPQEAHTTASWPADADATPTSSMPSVAKHLRRPLLISLFCYPHAPIDALVTALQQQPRPVIVLKADGVAPELGAGRRDNVHVYRLPFLPQSEFDRLLWSCDINFVRGEDSFVRAQWAGRPLCWHIYPQSANAHTDKLEAWLDRYPSSPNVRKLHHGWNGMDTPGTFTACLASLLTDPNMMTWREAAVGWSEHLARRPELADQLVEFCLRRLK